MTDITDTLTEGKSTVKKVDFKIADRTFKVGKLSSSQSIRLMTFFGKIMTNKLKRAAIINKLKENKNNSNYDDILTITEELEEKNINEFIGILLDSKDYDFISQEIGAEEITELFAIFCEYNDLGRILKNLFRVMEKATEAINKIAETMPETQKQKSDGK